LINQIIVLTVFEGFEAM